ncbi:VOC family protein [Paenibacillus sp. GSMTC-2017]|uniref:VOC family protein n=1 Tax=Paenibacillus sp. GSMTC-2017 TaxID=2794350 RepID=UPI0018D72625|nr:VOC family protein [Paenibacillus sp. GSMTC-2017]MBH5318841.1 VOC family protein [Paenibacillus sp. GSMTC-2017]
MKINHINLTVNDVIATKAFLGEYFGLQTSEENSETFDVLFDDDGSVLTLMKGKEVVYPKTFHIGFIQESEEKVDEINKRLKDDGYDVKPPKRLHGYTFYVEAPGGFTVEVLA